MSVRLTESSHFFLVKQFTKAESYKRRNAKEFFRLELSLKMVIKLKNKIDRRELYFKK